MTYGWTIERPSIELIASALYSVESTLKCHGIESEDFLFRVKVALSELMTNAITHGNSSKIGSITLHLTLEDNVLTFSISNESEWMPSDLPHLPLDPHAVSGRGLYLTEALSKRTIHENFNGRHICTVEMDLPPLGWCLQKEEDINNDRLMEELQECYELINGLLSMSEILSVSYDTPSFFRMCLERLVFLTGVDGALIHTFEHDNLCLRASYPKHFEQVFPAELSKNEFADEFDALLKGLTVVIYPSSKEETLEHLKNLEKVASLFPITIKDTCLGALMLLHPDKEKRFFSSAKVKIIKMVAWFSAMLISSDILRRKKAEDQLLLQEVEIASKIQRDINAPVDLFLPGIHVHAICEPALLSGGDCFEVIPMEDGSLFALVADVMGKGLAATLQASSLRAAVRALLSHESDPARLCTHINKVMFSDLNPVDMFITTSILLLSPDRSSINFCSAGHFPLLTFTPDGRVHQFIQNNPPLGIYRDVSYSSDIFEFGNTESILIYSDGLTDLTDQDEHPIGVSGLLSFLSKGEVGIPMFTNILDRLVRNRNLHKSDDITLVLIEQLKS